MPGSWREEKGTRLPRREKGEAYRRGRDSSVGRATDTWSDSRGPDLRQREKFLTQNYFLCWLLPGVRSTPMLPEWHVLSFCRKCRWQVTDEQPTRTRKCAFHASPTVCIPRTARWQQRHWDIPIPLFCAFVTEEETHSRLSVNMLVFLFVFLSCCSRCFVVIVVVWFCFLANRGCCFVVVVVFNYLTELYSFVGCW